VLTASKIGETFLGMSNPFPIHPTEDGRWLVNCDGTPVTVAERADAELIASLPVFHAMRHTHDVAPADRERAAKAVEVAKAHGLYVFKAVRDVEGWLKR
jgi:hypothetical protein